MPAPEVSSPEPLAPASAAWRPWESAWLQALALIGLWALLYLPNAGARELHNEEARRALPARAMLASGEWVQPQLFGRPYLNKPPLYMWSVAAAGQARGQVDVWAVRWPALIGTLLGALLAWLFARRAIDPRAGPWAGALYLLTWTVFTKGGLGEIEGLFGPLVLAGWAALWWAPRSWWATGAAALGFGAAFFAKGPPAAVFLGAGLIALSVVQGRAVWKGLRLPALILLSLVPVLLWTALLLQQVPADALMDRWSGELRREGDGGLGAYGKDRLRLISGVLLGFFPGLWLLLGAGQAMRTDPPAGATRYALWAALLSVLVFALPVGTRPRYVYPIAGLIAIAAADPIAVARARGHRFRSLPGWRPVAWLTGLLGIGLFVCAWLPQDVDPLKAGRPQGYAWMPVLVATAAGLVAFRRSVGGLRRDFLPWALLALAAGRHYQLVHVRPFKALETPHQDLAHTLQALVPAGSTLWTHAWTEFNTQAYLQPAPRWWTPELDADQPQGGDVLLIDPRQADDVVDRSRWEALLLDDDVLHRLRVYRRKLDGNAAGPR